MELRTLRYFLAAAQEGNITRAADILHLTQPTLSRQIMDLERELGVTLMLRGKNGLTLTDDGIFFRQRAQEIVELADRLEKNFAERQGSVSGMVVIGASEVAGGQTLAKLIREFSEKYPAVQFTLYNETVDNIKDRLDKGLVDIGLLLEPIDVTKYDYVRLARQDTWGLLVRDDHPLAAKASLTADDVASCPLLLPLRENIRAEILHWLGRGGRRTAHPAVLHAAVQRRPAGGRRAGLRFLHGRRAGHPQRPAPALYPAGAAPYDPQRAGVEEEQPVFPGCLPVHSGDPSAPGPDGIALPAKPPGHSPEVFDIYPFAVCMDKI